MPAEFREAYWTSRSGTFVRRLLLALLIGLVSGVIGELYGTLVYGADSGDYYRGFRTGFSIGLISALIEVFYIRTQRRSWIRRIAFLPGLIVRILVLTLIIRACLIGNELLTDFLVGEPLKLNFEPGQQFRDTVFAMVIVIAFVVLSQLTSIIGIKRFANLVVGRYYKPVNEERVFLFVDLVDSSNLARKLGNRKFHEFLAEFFYQLDRAIVRTGGEIVAYVGDAVIVTWPLGENRKKNARCLRALRLMRSGIEWETKNFIKAFGVAPQFRGAMHGGAVVVGECGDSRRQVTFLGDVVNVTSRIESLTKETGEQFLATKVLTDQMDIPDGIKIEPFGARVLRGSVEPLTMMRVVID